MGALDITPHVFAVNEVVTAATLNAEIHDKWQAVQDTWLDYIPVITGTSVNPILGTGGKANGRYKTIGKTVVYSGSVVFGTTGYNFGSGQIFISTPTNVNVTNTSHYGTCYVAPTGTTAWAGVARLFSSSFGIYTATAVANTALQGVTNATGVGGTAWGANAFINWTVTYEMP